ncbi:hypothetical protein Q8A67_020253 [Cirrhinus molitorella]|uniref:Uncharacterized protein n=1 Tax=Cirrhinus molitorella TaxID=172907 RepID=A0AA88TNI3_9TELE|nr:hypothetical protein Q8A67_020253 [Cirrhinus molitorella]
MSDLVGSLALDENDNGYSDAHTHTPKFNTRSYHRCGHKGGRVQLACRVTSLPPIQSPGYLKAPRQSHNKYTGLPWIFPAAYGSVRHTREDILLCAALPSHSLPQCSRTASAMAFLKERAYSAALCIEIALRENQR